MKCQRLLISALIVSALTASTTITSACDHSSQQGTGESSNASNGSNGSSDSAKGGNDTSTEGFTGIGQTESDGNRPVYHGPCGDWFIFGDTDWCQDIGKED